MLPESHPINNPMEPSRERSVPWGGLEAFPQLLLWAEVQHRKREGSKGKFGPAHLITQGAKPPGGDIRAGAFLVGIKFLKLCQSKAVGGICRGGRDVAFLGTARNVWGWCTHQALLDAYL